jgi:hypothetical protein
MDSTDRSTSSCGVRDDSRWAAEHRAVDGGGQNKGSPQTTVSSSPQGRRPVNRDVGDFNRSDGAKRLRSLDMRSDSGARGPARASPILTAKCTWGVDELCLTVRMGDVHVIRVSSRERKNGRNWPSRTMVETGRHWRTAKQRLANV